VQAAVHAAVQAAVQAADLDKCFPEAEKQPPHLRLVRGHNLVAAAMRDKRPQTKPKPSGTRMLFGYLTPSPKWQAYGAQAAPPKEI
jgi:hypothetical protein